MQEDQQQSQPPDIAGSSASAQDDRTGFGARGRTRRRVRFLRKARELAYRDLGGLVFNLHRFGQRNDPLVVAKLSMLDRIDSELRALEASLAERQPVTVLREAGITACPRCAAIHGSEDRFCPNCGLPVGRHADLPIAGSTLAGNGPNPAAPTPEEPPPASPQPAAAQPVASPPAPTASPATAEQRLSTDAQLVSAKPSSGASPALGRSPLPPASAGPGTSEADDPSPPAGADEPTEILRPPTISQ